MDNPEILDPLFREAVSAIDAGDVSALEHLLATHPKLVRDRLDYGEGYFRQPYLLWFVAENPIRNDKLPRNIYQGTPLDWAEHLQRTEIAAYLREKGGQ